ncbi:DUF4240 domain-containing protein [Actinocorallia longicatena]|uniref:DUF4240 domain-containing protein n=1 Tax=Actinocorallia longicatena TaxID=111803 RepID=A0ABP6QKZ9_9ACTN
MDRDTFWKIIEASGADHERLAGLLAERRPEEILDFRGHYDEVHHGLYRWDVWAAGYLIGGGCSDDSFMDFRAGVIAQGRDWYDRASASPDSLAEHPSVRESAAEGGDEALFYEDFTYAPGEAYVRATGTDDTAFYEALERRHPGGRPDTDMGEDFDFDDSAEMHRRLPLLASLFLP